MKDLAAPPEGDTARSVVVGAKPAGMREVRVSDDGASRRGRQRPGARWRRGRGWMRHSRPSS